LDSSKANPTSDFDLLFIQFFSEERCGQILSELQRAPRNPAPVYAGSEVGVVDNRVRKVAVLTPTIDIVTQVTERLLELREEIGTHFKITLEKLEQPQFLRYQTGDYFVAHQDGNTGMLRSEREQRRKISVIVFLNGQSDSETSGSFGGGSLVFSDYHPARQSKRFSLGAEPGMLVAFPAETTHEVTPVTAGERYSIVSWYG
jgi:predicted 2-oxoglutarate/Fe(II)-dependent dioxygenase YbiX